MTVVCCSTFVSYFDWSIGPHFDGATSNIGSAWCGMTATTDDEGHRRCCWPYPMTQQQLQSHVAPQVYVSYAMGPLQVSFSIELSLLLICLYMLVSVLEYIFCFQVLCWMPYSPLGAQQLGFAPMQPFRAYTWQEYLYPGHWPMLGMHKVAAPITALRRGEPFATR